MGRSAVKHVSALNTKLKLIEANACQNFSVKETTKHLSVGKYEVYEKLKRKSKTLMPMGSRTKFPTYKLTAQSTSVW
jgi:predicted DNA-binding protein YlxM (UPF0122 family)